MKSPVSKREFVDPQQGQFPIGVVSAEPLPAAQVPQHTRTLPSHDQLLLSETRTRIMLWPSGGHPSGAWGVDW